MKKLNNRLQLKKVLTLGKANLFSYLILLLLNFILYRFTQMFRNGIDKLGCLERMKKFV